MFKGKEPKRDSVFEHEHGFAMYSMCHEDFLKSRCGHD